MRLIKVSSSTCQPCKILSEMLKEYDNDLVNNMQEMDVYNPDNREFVIKAGLRSVPVLLLMDGDNIVQKIIGLPTKEALENMFRLAA